MRGFRKILMIGLGGSGKKILVNLKRHLLDSCGTVPPCFQFLAFDTDKSEDKAFSLNDGREITLDPGDLIHLELNNPAAFIENAPKPMQEMLYGTDVMSLRSINNGAHGIRIAGRLALLSNIIKAEKEIKNRIVALNDLELPYKMEQAKFELYGTNPEICICGSIAGGTGSGTFLDMGILCRLLAKEISDYNDLKIVGVFLLSWVYENMPTTQNCRANSYAALCELDYFMNLSSLPAKEKSKNAYKAYYNREVSIEGSPFDVVQLVDGRNEYGENKADVGKLIAAVSDAIACAVSELGDHAGSHLDNIIGTFAALPPGLWSGRFPHYTSFGVSALYYPAKENHAIQSLTSAIALLDEAKIFCKTSGAVSSADVTHELDSFLDDIQLDSDNPQAFASRLLGITGSDLQVKVPQDFDYGSRGIESRITSFKNQYMNRLDRILKDREETYYSEQRDELRSKIRERATIYRKAEISGGRPTLFTISWLGQLQKSLTEMGEHYNRTIRGCDTEDTAFSESEKVQLESIKMGSDNIFRRTRQEGFEKYTQILGQLLDLRAKRKTSETAVRIVRDMQDEVESQMATARVSTVKGDDVNINLNMAHGILQNKLNNIGKAFRQRKNNPFEVIVGEEDALYYHKEKKELPQLTFEGFKKEMGINSPTDLYKKPDEIENLFLEYAKGKWHFLLDTTIDNVLEYHAKNSPDYITTQFRHALRLSSALWSYNRGLLTPERQANMYHIVVCGHRSSQDGKTIYQGTIDNIGASMNMQYAPTWSSTDDPHRIVILRYAVSLPGYALSSMQEYRKRYELQVLPPTHFDKRFRFGLGDLFPDQFGEDLAFRILTLAIVPGIEVITDEKVKKGHRYTIDYPDELNDDYEPVTFDSFIDLFAYLLENDHVVKILMDKIVARVEEKGAAALKPVIETYLRKMQERFKSTDFTKQITGKYYYKEINLLKELLVCLERGKSMTDFFGQ